MLAVEAPAARLLEQGRNAEPLLGEPIGEPLSDSGEPATTLMLSPDGDVLVTSGEDGTVQGLLDLANVLPEAGEELVLLGPRGVLILTFPKSVETRRVEIPDGVTIDNVGKAIASFERAVVTGPSPWDYYDELRKLAAAKLAGEKPGQTLQSTALVHEAYIRLVDQDQVAWQDRAHFYCIAARVIANASGSRPVRE